LDRPDRCISDSWASIPENQFDNAFTHIVPISEQSQAYAGDALINLSLADRIAEARKPLIIGAGAIFP